MNARNVFIALLLTAACGCSAPAPHHPGMEEAFNGLVRDLVEEAFESVRNFHIEGDLAGLLSPHFVPPGRDDAPGCVFRAGFEYGILDARGRLYAMRETDDGFEIIEFGRWAS